MTEPKDAPKHGELKKNKTRFIDKYIILAYFFDQFASNWQSFQQ